MGSGERLTTYLDVLQFSKWGVGDISGLHPLSEQYPKALSLTVGYASKKREYDTEEFVRLLSEAHEKLNRKVDLLVQFLEKEKIPYTMLDGSASFSYTMAGAQAGLGWVGKSSLLVTPEYGPRIALQTILIDSDVVCNDPVLQSSCGRCGACMRSCELSCIKNVVWEPGTHASILRDGDICEEKGYACGRCVMICPVGR